MTEQIIIEGDRARHVRIETISESTLEALAPHLVTKLPTTFPVLPRTPTRYISFDPEKGSGLIIVEAPAKQHTLQISHHYDTPHTEDRDRRDDDDISRFDVQLPHQLFAFPFTLVMTGDRITSFTIRDTFLFWARDPVRTLDDPIWPASCPNVEANGRICWGSTRSDAASLSARIDDLVNNFFTTVFNEDLGHHTPFDNSISDWERNSQAPLAYRDWPIWNNEESVPLRDLAERLASAAPPNIAEMNPSFITLPQLPENFTVARARQWFDSLEEGARRRITAALNLVEEEATA